MTKKFKPPHISLGEQIQRPANSSKYGFIFSDDINEWIGSKVKRSHDEAYHRYKLKHANE